MSDLTLLQMVNKALGELGLPQQTTVIGNSDATTTQMLALINRCLDELRRWPETGWTTLQYEYDLVVRTPIQTTGNIAAFSKIITNIPDTTGIEANFWMVNGTSIPQAARVESVDSATQVTMSMEATNPAPLVAASLLFSKDTYALPSTYDWPQNRSMWDRTNQWELLGPDSPQIDQWHRSGIVVSGPRRHFRLIGPFANTFRVWPQPSDISAPLQLVFEYMSRSAVRVHGSYTAFSEFFENDDDTSILDAQALIMGLKWMFWEAKGFGSYITLQARWVDYVDKLIGRDGAAPTLSLARGTRPLLISPANVQDGNWPGGPGDGF